MKIVAMAGMIVLAFTPVIQAQVDVLCPIVGDTAEAVMENRQNGGVMSRLMALADPENQFYEMHVEIIKLAYSVPQYHSPEMKQRAIIDFRNEMELSCYTSQD